MTTEDNPPSSEPSQTSAGSPTSSTSVVTNNNNNTEKLLDSDRNSAFVLEELRENCNRAFSTHSEGSQDSSASLLPEVAFNQIGVTSNSLMGSPGRHANRENQPLLGNQRSTEIDDFNIITGL